MSSNMLLKVSCSEWFTLHPPLLYKLSLHHLDLSSNNINGQLNSNALSAFTGLISLILDHNMLTGIQDNVFDNMTNISEIGLSYNKLTVLTRKPFEKLLRYIPINKKPHLAQVRLIGNPIECGCYLDWMFDVVYGGGEDLIPEFPKSNEYHAIIIQKQYDQKRKDFLRFLEESKCYNFYVDMSLWLE